MKKIFIILIFVMVGCQAATDDQGGINDKIENFVKDKLYANSSVESIEFSRFLRGRDRKQIYFWLDYTFSIKTKGHTKVLKYHFETDSLLNIIHYENISSKLTTIYSN